MQVQAGHDLERVVLHVDDEHNTEPVITHHERKQDERHVREIMMEQVYL